MPVGLGTDNGPIDVDLWDGIYAGWHAGIVVLPEEVIDFDHDTSSATVVVRRGSVDLAVVSAAQ